MQPGHLYKLQSNYQIFQIYILAKQILLLSYFSQKINPNRYIDHENRSKIKEYMN